MKIKQFDLKSEIEENLKEFQTAFAEILATGNFILGPKLLNFEKNYAKFCNTNFCVGVGNGLDALEISLLALGVKQGDEVIVPAHTFIATALAVSKIGAIPVFADVDADTFLLDPKKIEKLITKKTKVIIPVHLYGLPAEFEELDKIAKNYKLFLLEDGAQAQGAEYNGKRAGSLGQISATSFYPTKNLGAFGDAGAITTSDKTLDENCRLLRNYGQSKKYVHETVGGNSRLDEIQAAFLDINLQYLSANNKKRASIAKRYESNLAKISAIKFQKIPPNCASAYHQFVIKVNRRDELLNYLSDNGVDCGIHYPTPVHLQKAYKALNHKVGDFPIAEEIAQNILSLPMYPNLNSAEVDLVSEKIETFFKTKN